MPKHLKLALIVGGVAGLVWLILNLVPFALMGRNWGMAWFPINMPLSGIIEDTYGIGPDSVGFIGLVSLANALGVGLIAGLLALFGALLWSRT